MAFSQSEINRLKNNYGSRALITGASSGIGLELAERLAEAGFSLILNSRRVEELEKVKKLLHLKYNTAVVLVPADVSTQEGINDVIKAAEAIDVGLFIASAGFGTSGEFIKSAIDEELNMLRVNCEGLLKLTHHFAREFAKKKRGGIILMSSMVAFQGVPFAAHYAATKAYVQSFAEALAIELKPYGVDVLAAAPGPVKSGFRSRANMKMDMALTPEQIGAPILKALGRKTTVLPGFLTKLLVYSLRTVPRWGKVRIMKLVMGGMTQHQRG
jgi:short-subunit dehydrogenase